MVNWYQYEVTSTSFEVMYAYDKFEVENTVKTNGNSSKVPVQKFYYWVSLNFTSLEKMF